MNIEIKKDVISQMYFDALDLKETLEAYEIDKIKRVHDGQDNEETTADLIENILWHIEKIYDQFKEEA